MWVTSNFSGAALGAEANKLMNFLLHFGCASEEFRFVVSNLADWMANYSPLLGRLPCSSGMSPRCTG